MISFIVKMRFTAEDRAQVTDILRNLALASRQEPGCVTYVPHRIEDDPDTVLIYEQYADPAALDAHRAAAHFKKYAVSGLYQLMKDRSTETLTAVV